MTYKIDDNDFRGERAGIYLQEPEMQEQIHQIDENEFNEIYVSDTSLTLDAAFRKARAMKAQRSAIERKRIKAAQRARQSDGYGRVMF